MILNRTRNVSERYRIIPGNMGNYGEPTNSPNHKWVIVSGIDRGNGYQGYMSVSYFLSADFVPDDAKEKCLSFLEETP